MSNDLTAGFGVFASFARVVSSSEQRELEDQLGQRLPSGHFRFRHGELHLHNLASADIALPLMGDLLEGVWTDRGKDLTDRYLPVFDTHRLRCPSCEGDSQLDLTVSVDVRLIRSGTSLDDARDQTIRWNENSRCSCSCGWSGAVVDARR